MTSCDFALPKLGGFGNVRPSVPRVVTDSEGSSSTLTSTVRFSTTIGFATSLSVSAKGAIDLLALEVSAASWEMLETTWSSATATRCVGVGASDNWAGGVYAVGLFGRTEEVGFEAYFLTIDSMSCLWIAILD